MDIENVVSYYDGISCGQVALGRANIKYNKYYAAEIDKYAKIVTQHSFPATKQIGDVQYVDYSKLNGVDLLIGGSPCQGFSFAGKQMNFNDPRSKLFFEFVRALDVLKPKYFLLENVKMKKEYENVISSYLGVEPIIINSSLQSAQNRNRLYWTNIPHISLPLDKKIYWGDIREHNVNDKSFYYSKKALQWLSKVSKNKNKLLKIHLDNEKMQMLEASHYKKYSNQRFFGIIDEPTANIGQHVIGSNDEPISFVYNENKKCLFTKDINGKIFQFTKENTVYKKNISLRYITPLECERLQTLPDNYTSIISNTQRYKALGNGWTVDVIAHIFKNII